MTPLEQMLAEALAQAVNDASRSMCLHDELIKYLMEAKHGQ